MIFVEHFSNELMNSNCYVVHQDNCDDCIVIDPGSNGCEELIRFFEKKKLTPSYVFLTHEHTDHTWGANTLIDKYSSKVVATKKCKESLLREGKVYFLYYYNKKDYMYCVKKVDITIDDLPESSLFWHEAKIVFHFTPGHSKGSMCISLENMLFSGDTIMLYKPVISKRSNGSIEEFNITIDRVLNLFSLDTMIYPGHGVPFSLKRFEDLRLL